MKPSPPLLLLALLLAADPSAAVILISTDDPSFDTTAPGGALQDGGWNFEGQWGPVLGTAIGWHSFVTAQHVGGTPGDTFLFQGQAYLTDRVDRDPGSDLAVWHVTSPFPVWAPLYRNGDEVGRDLVVIGRGTLRGDPAILGVPPTPRGWYWGPGDQVQRWGTNTVSAIVPGAPGEGDLLAADFDLGVSDTEATLSSGDSGGGVFVQDVDQHWKLAGINFEVDDYALDDAQDTPLPSPTLAAFGSVAALYDQSGLLFDPPPDYGWIPAGGAGRFYATRISAHLAFLDSVVDAPEPSAGALAAAAVLALGALAASRRRARPVS